MEDGDYDKTTGWVKTFHRSGLLVTLPVYGESYAEMYACVDAILAAGFLPVAPGLEAGEQRQDVGYVVKKGKEKDGQFTPVLDLYAADEGQHFSFVSVYLNTPRDVAAFEFASGMKLDAIPEYVGTNKIERGKDSRTDRLVVRAPKPFGVVFGANPKYDEATANAERAAGRVYKVPARKFIRWVDELPESQVPREEPRRNPQPAPNAQRDEAQVQDWQRWLLSNPSSQELNLGLPKLSAMSEATKRAVWQAIVGYAKRSMMEFDPTRKVFMPAPSIDTGGAF